MSARGESAGVPRVESLYRYPIKGLSPERLESVDLAPGTAILGDRMYALAKPDGRYDADNFTPLPKREYFVLLNTARLAGLDTRVDPVTRRASVAVQGRIVLETDLGTAAGRAALTGLFARVADLPEGSTPVLAEQPGYNFSDLAPNGTRLMNSISIINLASITEFEGRIGRAVDPLRFRANVYVDGVPAWGERDWVGRILRFGDVRLRVLEESGRCAATEVDPSTAKRDIPVPRLLVQEYGHDIMGVYAEILDGGTLSPGDTAVFE